MKKWLQRRFLFVLAAILFLSTIPLFADKRADLTAALGKAIYYDIDITAVASLLEAGADPNGIFSTYDYEDKQTFLLYCSIPTSIPPWNHFWIWF